MSSKSKLKHYNKKQSHFLCFDAKFTNLLKNFGTLQTPVDTVAHTQNIHLRTKTFPGTPARVSNAKAGNNNVQEPHEAIHQLPPTI